MALTELTGLQAIDRKQFLTTAKAALLAVAPHISNPLTPHAVSFLCPFWTSMVPVFVLAACSEFSYRFSVTLGEKLLLNCSKISGKTGVGDWWWGELRREEKRRNRRKSRGRRTKIWNEKTCSINANLVFTYRWSVCGSSITLIHQSCLLDVLRTQSSHVSQFCATVFPCDCCSSASKGSGMVMHYTVIIIRDSARVDSAWRHLCKLRTESWGMKLIIRYSRCFFFLLEDQLTEM